jgi:hypothetical protein
VDVNDIRARTAQHFEQVSVSGPVPDTLRRERCLTREGPPSHIVTEPVERNDLVSRISESLRLLPDDLVLPTRCR